MVVFAANVSTETLQLINELLVTPEFVKFTKQNRLNLNNKTVLIRLAIINLTKNLPNSLKVSQYKAALLKPLEFNDFLKGWIEKK